MVNAGYYLLFGEFTPFLVGVDHIPLERVRIAHDRYKWAHSCND